MSDILSQLLAKELGQNKSPLKGPMGQPLIPASQKNYVATGNHGPAYGGDPMSLVDWQNMTGVYDAAPDKELDTWTPTGFGVPGVPRETPGLTDVTGRPITEHTVANEISQKPDPGADNKDSYKGPQQADAQTFAKKAVDKQKHYANKDEGMAEWARLHPELAAKSKAKSHNPLMQSTFGYQTGEAPDQLAAKEAANRTTGIGPVANGMEYASSLAKEGTSGIGPVADGDVYAQSLATQGTTGIGPVADGDAYASLLGNKETRTNSQGVEQKGTNMSWKDSVNAPRFIDTTIDNGTSNVTYSPTGEDGDDNLIDFNSKWSSNTQPGQFPSQFGAFQ